jgi:hypothetical protein
MSDAGRPFEPSVGLDARPGHKMLIGRSASKQGAEPRAQ